MGEDPATASLASQLFDPLEPRLLLSTLYYVDSFLGDGTWPGAYADLQAALAVATSGDEIWVAAGTYRPTSETDRSIFFQLKAGLSLYGGFIGGETSRDQRDWQAHQTILSGDIGAPGDSSDNSYHVVIGADGAILDGCTVTQGNANGDGPRAYGGGMCNDNCSPTLANCTIVENIAADYGGGMYNSQSSCMVSDCIFTANQASQGGGMYNEDSSPTLARCSFSGNVAVVSGGGVLNDYSPAELTDCLFEGNSAQSSYGGGLRNWHSSAIVTNCLFTANAASDDGGAIHNRYSPSEFTNCTIVGNSAANYGGGMCNSGSEALPLVVNSIIWENKAAVGRSIYNYGSTTDIPTISYSDVQDCGGSGASWNASLGLDGGGNIDADPLFADPGHWDGGNWVDGDYHLRPASPCINSGSSAGAVVFADAAVAAGGQDFVLVADASHYAVGDEIECSNDGVLRTVTAVDVMANAVTFDESLLAPSWSGMPVNNYGWGDMDGQDRLVYGFVDMGADEFVISGDANCDGTVDGADYTLWADHYKTSGGWGAGDFNNDNFVDGADYTLWADHFEESVGGAGGSAGPAAVQEAQVKAEAPELSLALASVPRPATKLVSCDAAAAQGQPDPAAWPFEPAAGAELAAAEMPLPTPVADPLALNSPLPSNTFQPDLRVRIPRQGVLEDSAELLGTPGLEVFGRLL